jgi:flagellar motor switch protein FliG
MTAKDTIVDALGEERARGILGGLNMVSGSSRSLESLEMVDAKSLANFLVNEHPQTVAVILSTLNRKKRGRS